MVCIRVCVCVCFCMRVCAYVCTHRERDKAAASRADAKLQHVILSEKYDRKAMSRYTTEQVPFPFDSRETYERSMRQVRFRHTHTHTQARPRTPASTYSVRL